MPWCEGCDRYLSPNTVVADGTCPTCGQAVSSVPTDPAAAADSDTVPPPSVPWHFWLLVIPLVVYLGWRLVQGVMWLISHID